MTRYTSIDEVNAALIELEQHDLVILTEKAMNEKQSDGEFQKLSHSSVTVNVDGRNDVGHFEGESESCSDSGSLNQDGHDDEEEIYEDKTDDGFEGDGDDEEDGGGLVGSDYDENVQVRQKVVKVDPEEVEEFDRELRAMMQESLDSRKLELRARPTLNMTIPMNVFEGSKDPRTVEGESGEEMVDEDGWSGGGNKVRVKVLVKKGSKQQTKQMYIPQDCMLVQSTKQKEAAELEEKQNIKRRILEYNEREEDDGNGISGQAANWLVGSSGSKLTGRTMWEVSSKATAARNRQQSGYYYGYNRRR